VYISLTVVWGAPAPDRLYFRTIIAGVDLHRKTLGVGFDMEKR
jgi:hypothetical protein